MTGKGLATPGQIALRERLTGRWLIATPDPLPLLTSLSREEIPSTPLYFRERP